MTSNYRHSHSLAVQPGKVGSFHADFALPALRSDKVGSFHADFVPASPSPTAMNFACHSRLGCERRTPSAPGDSVNWAREAHPDV